MELPSILRGESRTRLFQGAVAGSVLTMVVGFGWAGWTLGGTAREMAQKSGSAATVAALAPICATRFQSATDAASNLVEFRKISSWQHSAFIEKGGWATFPGASSADSAVARACGELIAML